MAARHIIFTSLAIAAVAVGATSWYLNVERQAQTRVAVLNTEGPAAAVPLGIGAGADKRITVQVDNPLASDPNAAAEGHRLFLSMNCASCHGYDAKGGMGPNLTDTQWRYGGTAVDVFKSIYEGRPKGMPAWGTAFPANSIWQIVSYIKTLGGMDEPGSAAPNQQAAAGEGQ